VGSSFGFVIPFSVVELLGVQQSARSRSASRPDVHHVSGPSYTHNKSKFVLPSLSGRLVPLRNTAQELSLEVDDSRSSPNFSGKNVVSSSPLEIPLESDLDMELEPYIPDRMHSGSAAMLSLDTSTCALSPTQLKTETGSLVQRMESLSDVSAMVFNEEGSLSAALSETSASIVKCISGNTSVTGSEKRCFISSPGGRIAPDTGLSLSRGLTSASRTTSQMSCPLLGVEMAGATRSASEKAEKKMSFLLVDDTASNCKMLKMLLKKKGIECDMAFNGREAVDAYKRALSDSCVRRAATIYEVIFMDYTMPIMVRSPATSSRLSLYTLRSRILSSVIISPPSLICQIN
jgi:CheY-like chemotaxis protein